MAVVIVFGPFLHAPKNSKFRACLSYPLIRVEIWSEIISLLPIVIILIFINDKTDSESNISNLNKAFSSQLHLEVGVTILLSSECDGCKAVTEWLWSYL